LDASGAREVTAASNPLHELKVIDRWLAAVKLEQSLFHTQPFIPRKMVCAPTLFGSEFMISASAKQKNNCIKAIFSTN
jgi:hypothetical protein